MTLVKIANLWINPAAVFTVSPYTRGSMIQVNGTLITGIGSAEIIVDVPPEEVVRALKSSP